MWWALRSRDEEKVEGMGSLKDKATPTPKSYLALSQPSLPLKRLPDLQTPRNFRSESAKSNAREERTYRTTPPLPPSWRSSRFPLLKARPQDLHSQEEVECLSKSVGGTATRERRLTEGWNGAH